MSKLTREMVDSMTDQELQDLISEYLDLFADDSPVKEFADEKNLYADIMRASKNKRSKSYIQEVIGTEYENVFECEDENLLLKTIRNAQLMILMDEFEPRYHTPVVIKDTCNKKPREIIKPDFGDEQVIHHAVIRMIMPELRKGMYRYTCASIPQRGIHYVHKNVKRVISNDPKNTKYVLKMDIRKFFDSIPHRLLKKRLRKIVKDPTIRKILFRIIDTTERGLPLGFFTSQWLANYYLQPLDHYIKERILDDCDCNTARTGRHGAVYYFRYMDDMVIFGPNKKELHKMREKISEVLERDFGLHLKYDWQVFRFDYIDKKTGLRKGRPLDYVGFQFYHDRVTIRKRTYKKIKALIKHLVKKGIDRVTFHEAAAMLSYYGFIYWSDSKGLYTKLLRPYITLKELKNIIKVEYKRRASDPHVEEADD